MSIAVSADHHRLDKGCLLKVCMGASTVDAHRKYILQSTWSNNEVESRHINLN